MNTLKDVKLQARAINGDPDGEWMSDAYLVPIINHVYTLQINYLSNTCSVFDEDVRVIPNVSTGSSDLTAFQKSGQPLDGIIEPYRQGVEWKLAGQPDQQYKLARKVGKLPDIPAPGATNLMYWEWRAFKLFVTPMAFACDIRVRGDFRPPALIKDEDVITVHPMMDAVLAEEAASAAWRERQNAGALQSYQLVATAALDDIANQLVRGEQSTPLRVARANRGRRGRR